LCGWLLPGPKMLVPAGAPFVVAICAAVLPLPYFFDASACPAPAAVGESDRHVTDPALPPVVQDVFLSVAFVGFMPGSAVEFCAALPCAVSVVAAAAFFSWRGAFAEFPGFERLAHLGNTGCKRDR
jgi:hypothetical protein